MIELMLALVVFTIVSGLVLVSILTSNQTYATSQALVNVQQEARRALQFMARELRGAGGAVTGWGSSQFNFQLGLGYNLAGTVPGCLPDAFCWGAIDANGTPNFNWSVRYMVNGTQLVREVLDTGGVVTGMRVLANNVSQITFTDVGGAANTVGLHLQVVQQGPLFPGGVKTSPGTLHMQVRLRGR